MLFGLPFMAAGGFMLAAGLGAIPLKGGNAPLALLLPMGACFFSAGALVSFQGLRGRAAERKREEGQARDPGRPWLWDSAWDASGVDDDGVARTGGYFLGGGFMVLFLIPFNWWAWVSDESVFMVKAIVSLFDFITLTLLCAGVYRLFVGLKYGRSRLRFDSFPFFMGEKVAVTLLAAERLRDFRAITATLTCCEQRETRDSDGKTSTTEFTLWQEKSEFKAGELILAGSLLPLSLRLPPGEPAKPTDLSSYLKVYWKLELIADTPGLDFSAVFPLPVYRR